VKYAILEAVPNVVSVLVHMEPYRESRELSGGQMYVLPPVKPLA
jgi:hypothetical protein